MSDQTALENAAATWTCRYCGVTGAVRIEWRQSLVSKPLGTFSLAGVGLKTSAVEAAWPWAVCQPEHGGCGHESRGRYEPAQSRTT